MNWLMRLPLLITLIGFSSAAMYLPATVALIQRDHAVARAFFYSGTLFLTLALLLGVATARRAPGDAGSARARALWGTRQRGTVHIFGTLVGVYVVVPPLMAVPMVEAVADLSFARAWFEMVSSLTTTGATVFDSPRRVTDAIHLWRALAGWMGGGFILVAAVAYLAPLNLGGFELLSGRSSQEAERSFASLGDVPRQERRDFERADPLARFWASARAILPAYAAVTLILWLALTVTGNSPLMSLSQAMSTISTSGILPAAFPGAGGLWAEAVIALGLLFALTRRSLPGMIRTAALPPLREDPELRLAGLLIATVTLTLLIRHWLGAAQVAEGENLPAAGRALWGAGFTALSFITTTGFVSQDWVAARAWSGLTTPGLILMGLAMAGGGVATAAGGLKLLRVYALFIQGRRELEKMVIPSSVGGDGSRLRYLRTKGAFAAWLFLMVFILTQSVVMGLLLIAGLSFETALIYAIAALTTTGPLVSVAGDVPLSWADLTDLMRAILGVTMVLGRLELLLFLGLLVSGTRRD